MVIRKMQQESIFLFKDYIIKQRSIFLSAAKRNKLKLNFPMSPKTPKFTPLKEEVKMQTDEDSATEPPRSTLESMGHPTQM